MLKRLSWISYSYIKPSKTLFSLRPYYFSSNEKDPSMSNSKIFSKEYISKLKDNLTDFQNEFGFDETLKERRLENLQQEKRAIRNFNVFAILALTTVVSSFLMMFDREKGFTDVAKWYYTHKTNLALKGADLWPGIKSSQKKLNSIEIYLKKMKENNITNTAFTKIILQHLSFITQKLINDYEGQKTHSIKVHSPTHELERIVLIISEILTSLHSEKYKETLKYSSNLISHSLIRLISSNIIDIKKNDRELYECLNIIAENLTDKAQILLLIEEINKLLKNETIDINKLKLESFQSLAEKIRSVSHANPTNKQHIKNIEDEMSIPTDMGYFEVKNELESIHQRCLAYNLTELTQYFLRIKNKMSTDDYKHLLFLKDTCASLVQS